MSDVQVVVFKLNNQMFGAETSQVKLIIRYQEATKVPRMPRFLDGIINLRGKVVPVIDLNKRFEIGEMEITKKTKIIVTEVAEKQVGFIVNDVSEITRFSEDEIETAPQVIHNNENTYLKLVGKKGDQLVSIIDLEKVLNENEVKRLPKNDEK